MVTTGWIRPSHVAGRGSSSPETPPKRRKTAKNGVFSAFGVLPGLSLSPCPKGRSFGLFIGGLTFTSFALGLVSAGFCFPGGSDGCHGASGSREPRETPRPGGRGAVTVTHAQSGEPAPGERPQSGWSRKAPNCPRDEEHPGGVAVAGTAARAGQRLRVRGRGYTCVRFF